MNSATIILWLGPGFVTRGSGGPFGERQPVDLSVVANINRKARTEIKQGDGRRVGMLQPELTKLAREFACITRINDAGLDDERGTLLPWLANSNERTPCGARMSSEHLLTRFRVQRASRGLNALRFAAAKPKAAVAVAIAAISHPVPD
jgi:hypothetical protein